MNQQTLRPGRPIGWLLLAIFSSEAATSMAQSQTTLQGQLDAATAHLRPVAGAQRIAVESSRSVQLANATDACDVTCGCACGDPNCCGGGQCGRCRDVCCVTREEVEVDKYCWNVNCEKICVPGITFPWEGCGWSFLGHKKASRACDACTGACNCRQAYKPARCGRVVCVRTLEKHD
jgi:hypothetical protein